MVISPLLEVSIEDRMAFLHMCILIIISNTFGITSISVAHHKYSDGADVKHEFACPNGFIRFHRSCYKLSNMRATWLEAQGYCHAMSGGLVTIENARENQFLVDIIKKHRLSYPRSFWTGGNDLANEGDWEWVSTYQKVRYSNWYHRQPDNSHRREHCLELERKYGYRWNDQPCYMRNHFICEMYMV